MKRKFLLISDNTSYAIGGVRYLGPYRIADELEKVGIECIVLDRFYSYPDFFNLLDKIYDSSFLGIGISSTFFTPPEFLPNLDRYINSSKRSKLYYDYGIIDSDLSKSKEWFQRVKSVMQKRSPGSKIFIGGAKAQHLVHPKFDNLTEIDYLVLGVVDLVFPKILIDLQNGIEPKFNLLGTKKVIDTIAHYKQPQQCPYHQWRKHWFVQPGEALPLEIARGCAFNCKFCNYQKRSGNRKSVEDVRRELIYNFENFGTQHYLLSDDCFNDSRGKVESICSMIISLPFKIEWASYVRFDVAVKFPETADLMVQAGGRGFYWGVESLTPMVARRAGKGTDPEAIKKFIVEFAKKYEGLCYSTGSFICGLPGETEESWKQQIDWLENSKNFNFLQMGPLAIPLFKPEFDGPVVDYSEYSRSPEKYGFFEMDPSRNYWRHETMDQPMAEELSKFGLEKWEAKNRNRRGLSTDVWIYPVLRSLGYSLTEVNDLYFSTDQIVQAELIVKGREWVKARLNNYFFDLDQFLNISPAVNNAEEVK